MPGLLPNRIALVAAAAVIAAGVASALAVAFPGRVERAAILAPEEGVIATPFAPEPSLTPSPSPSPTPTAAVAAAGGRTFVPRRSTGGTPACAGVPGPACRAASDQPRPASPREPRDPVGGAPQPPPRSDSDRGNDRPGNDNDEPGNDND